MKRAERIHSALMEHPAGAWVLKNILRIYCSMVLTFFLITYLVHGGPFLPWEP